MADKYFDPVLGADGNAGTQLAPKQTLVAARTALAAGDNVYLVRGGDWTAISDTVGSNGWLEMGAANQIIADYGDSTLAKPKIGFTVPASVNITSIVIVSNVATVTATAHGVDGGGVVVNFAGVTGAASGINGYQKVVTRTSANVFTVALTAADGTSTNGSVQTLTSTKACIYNNGFAGCRVSNIQGWRTRYMCSFAGVITAGSAVDGAGFYGYGLEANYMGDSSYAHGSTSGSTYIQYDSCTAYLGYGDGWNFGATSNFHTLWSVYRCTGSYLGLNPDGTANNVSGNGDGCSAHATNWGTTKGCTFFHTRQGGVTHVNTTGTNIVNGNFIYEFAEAGIEINSGGTGAVFNNIIIAPVTETLTGSTGVYSCMDHKNASPCTFYSNSCYTARGSTNNDSVVCMSNRGTGVSTARNNLLIGNGTAFMARYTGTGKCDWDYNAWSHTGSLYQVSAGTKTYAQFVALATPTPPFTAGAFETHSVTGATTILVTPPTTASHFRLLTTSIAKNSGQNLTASATGSFADLVRDFYGVTRPASGAWNIGAIQRAGRPGSLPMVGVGN